MNEILPVTFPRTKCIAPTTYHVLERRDLVASVVAQVEAHRVVLVSAPAGAGKTSLLAALVGTLRSRQTAWLTLDSEDSEPKRFLLGVVAALQSITSTFGARTLAVLADAPSDLPPRQLVGALINDLLDDVDAPFVLILDDLHEVHDPETIQALNYLIERLPANGRVVLAARHDPPLALASLRARGHLAELRFDTLRFSLDEARQFINAQVPITLPDDALVHIHQRTEGWPAGLRLIALSIARQLPLPLISALQPIGQEQHIFDLFAQEVLNRQDTDLQRFLLETSILTELTPQLCHAVTDRADAGDILDHLHRHNLFVVALDTALPSYRYHALFRVFLQQRLMRTMPDALPALHLRAGLAEPDHVRAVPHLFAAEAWEAAATRVEAAALLLHQRGQDVPHAWLDALPKAIVAQRASLSFFYGLQAVEGGTFASARTALERAIALYAAAGDTAMQGEVMTHLAAASIHSYTADGFVRALQLCDDALALPGTPTTQARAYLGRVWNAFYANDEAAVETGLVSVMELMLTHDDVRLAQRVMPSLNLVLFPALRQRTLLARFVDTVHRRYAEGYGRLQVQVWALLAGLHTLEGRLLEAQTAATHAAQLMEYTGELVYVGFANNLILAMLALARGDVRASEELFARCYEAGRVSGGDQDNSVFYVLYLALARARAGNINGVEELAQLVRRGARPELLPAHATTIGQVEALADLARGDAAAAVNHLRPLAAQQPSLLERSLAPDARLLLGYAYWRLRQYAEAQAVVTPVLALTHDRGWPSMLLRHGRLITPLLEWAMRRNIYPITTKRALDMLESYGTPAPVGVPDSQETISVREMDVLRMIVAGASNQEIADALTISVWTVKSHVTSLLAKLGATSRTQAAARARELRLL